MTVVDDHGRTGDLEDVESGRYFVHLRRERLETEPNLFGWQTESPARGGRSQNVFHLKADSPAHRERNSVERQQREFVLALSESDRVIANEGHASAFIPALHDQRVTSALG